MPPFWVTWPLRKAAVIPAVAIGAIAVGATAGAFDLTYRSASLVLSPKTRRNGTALVSWSAALISGSGILAIRELVFAPSVVPPPKLPLDSSVPLPARARNAGIVMMHTVMHYPYQFRFTNAFVVGVAAALAYAVAERAYNTGGSAVLKDGSANSGASVKNPASIPTSQVEDVCEEDTAAVFTESVRPSFDSSESSRQLNRVASLPEEDVCGTDGSVSYTGDPYEQKP